MKTKKVNNVPTNDFLNNPIDIGDVIVVSQYSRFTVGKVVSLNLGSITVTCERVPTKRNRWTPKGMNTVDVNEVSNSIPWNEQYGLNYIQKALSFHNGTKCIRVYRGLLPDVERSIINLTKLNIYHENP
jgi:hypothetical protein